MLTKIAHSIIKYRLALIIILLGFTAFMAYKARNVEMNYSFIKAVPDTDEDMIYFQKFRNMFGEDGNIIILGFEGKDAYTDFKKYKELESYVRQIEKTEGVTAVLGIPNLIELQKDKETKSFIPKKIFENSPKNQSELDECLERVYNQKFYEDQIINSENGNSLLAITISNEFNDSKKKDITVNQIIKLGENYTKSTSIKVHYAGLPYLRSWKAQKVADELRIFLGLSLLVTGLVLLFFFRSFYSVVVPMVIIAVMVIWSMGTMGILGYQVSILTGLIPPIIVVIGIPNSVYLLTKYHQEYRKHGNKIKALSQIIRKIGVVTLITNLTTAIGFLVVVFTEVDILKEFGLVAGLNVMGVFLASVILVPAIFAYLPPPKSKHLRHLDFKFFTKVLSIIDNIVVNHRPKVYVVSIVIVLASLVGIYIVKPVSYMVDDLPEDSVVRKDLAFFEYNFTGIMPLEIVVDTKSKNGITKLSTLKKIEKLQKLLEEDQYISKAISVTDFVKVFSQAYYKNNEKFYRLPNNQDRVAIMSYLKNSKGTMNQSKGFVDSTGQIARISMRVADIGSIKLDSLLANSIQPKIDTVFGDTDFEVKATGTTLIFTKGTKFLINNLRSSLLLAFILIALTMAALFGSMRMVMISMAPNIIPLMITGAIMGVFNIPLKPSTAIIFSIVFGIAVDDAIHYLAKYRQELIANNFNVSKAVSISLKETGSSMIYTSIVLFFGFIIFTFSEFGGTIALGLLSSITLFCALITNLVVLPSLILSFDNGVRRFRRKEHYGILDEYLNDEEELSEEIDHNLLQIKVKGEVFEEIYNQEIEDLKNNKN